MPTRTFSWHDPAIYASASGLTGLEFLRAIMSGELPRPPVAEMLGMRGVELERGRVVFVMEVGESHYNPLNIVHGGMTATLLDTVMGCAVQTTLDAGVGYSTTDLQVRFVRAVTVASGTLRAEGTVVHAGSRVVTAEGRVVDGAGKLVAHGSCGCVVGKLSQQSTVNSQRSTGSK
jgi:uncharacterized protein (TIGR00369 family)